MSVGDRSKIQVGQIIHLMLAKLFNSSESQFFKLVKY